MTTVNLQVSADNDDADESQAGADFDATANVVRAHSDSAAGSRYVAGHRLTNVTIPKSADILTATIQVWTLTAAQDANLDIHAEAVDDAVDFAADADVWTRVRTSASTSWVENTLGSDTGFATSPEIKAVIQEIVDRAGWVSGNDLVIILKGKSDIAKSFYTRAHETVGGDRALKLDIEYATVRKRSYARTIL